MINPNARLGERSSLTRNFVSPTVLSLGSLNADFQTRVTQPIEGVTSQGSDFTRRSGGKAANVALLAHRLSVPALLLASVGGDQLSEQALNPLRDAGLDLSAVTVAREHATAVSMIAVAPNGTKSIVLANNANDAWSKMDAQAMANIVRAAPIGSVLVTDYEIPPAVVRLAIEAAVAKGLMVIVDPSFPDRVERDVISTATAITPDASEASTLTGIDASDLGGAMQAARKMVAWGISIACVKLGAGGCLLAHRGDIWVVPPLPFERVDSTGAGDAFASALAVAFIEGRPVLNAVCFATAAAHIAITRYGSQESYPTRDELNKLLPKLMNNAYEVAAS